MKIDKLPALSLSGPSTPKEANELSAWLGALVKQVQKLTQGAQKFFSIGENLNTDLKEDLPFRQNEEQTISVDVKVRIVGVLVVDSEVRTQPFPRPTLRRMTNHEIGLKMTWDTDPGGYKGVSFLVIGG